MQISPAMERNHLGQVAPFFPELEFTGTVSGVFTNLEHGNDDNFDWTLGITCVGCAGCEQGQNHNERETQFIHRMSFAS